MTVGEIYKRISVESKEEMSKYWFLGKSNVNNDERNQQSIEETSKREEGKLGVWGELKAKRKEVLGWK